MRPSGHPKCTQHAITENNVKSIIKKYIVPLQYVKHIHDIGVAESKLPRTCDCNENITRGQVMDEINN